ncbi:MAG TPA: hypothetical protein VH951_08350, partial [Dehalococcoidia bacterium]
LINGRDLMQTLGLPQGPEVGRLIAAIEEARAAGEVTTREEALDLARSLATPPSANKPSPSKGSVLRSSKERGLGEGAAPHREKRAS